MWEYKVIEDTFALSSADKISEILNRYGADGWELATVRMQFFIFKRPIEPAKGGKKK